MINYEGAICDLSPERYRVQIKHNERTVLDVAVMLCQ